MSGVNLWRIDAMMRTQSMISPHELAQRYSAFVSTVSRRLETIGHDPSVLISVPELYELAAVTLPGEPVMFAMYVEAALENGRPIEQVADQFVAGWLRQLSI